MKKKLLSLLMTIMMVQGLGVGLVSYADEPKVEVKSVSQVAATEHESTATVTAVINASEDISNVEVSFDKGSLPGNATPSSSNGSSLKKGDNTFSWSLDITGLPMGKNFEVYVKVWEKNGRELASKMSYVGVNANDSENIGKPNLPLKPKDYTYKPDSTVNYSPRVKMKVIAPSGGLTGGSTSSVQLTITNTGNAPFNQVSAGVSTLGDKMTLQNAPTEQQLGSMGRNEEKTVSFPIHVESAHPGGNVPIGFAVKAIDPTGKETSFSITEYVTVNSGNSLADRLEIINVSNPSTVVPNQDFTLSFAVRNNSSFAAKNVKITVEPTAPVVNKSKNIYVISLAGGESKAFSVKMFATVNAESQAQNYPIKITAETTGPEASSIIQYSGVFVNSGNEKTVPQLIITNYTYGGSSVAANEVYALSLVIKNTNAQQTIKNIKVSMLAEEGVFIPHNSSNSFYIASIAPGGSVTKIMEMMTKPDAPEKTVAINVDMTYEDKNGTPVTVKDIISVPVVQRRRIEVDEIKTSETLYVGQQTNISVQYYNLGKSTLSNLTIHAEGDFDFPQSTKTFVGKFDPGKNDFYDLQIVPKHAGEASGKLIFDFEDSSGKQITIEKPFKLTAEEAPPVEPPTEDLSPKGGNKKKILMGIGGATVLAAAGTIIYRKKRKKMNDSLDIDNE